MEPLVNMQLVTNAISVKNNHLPAGTFNLTPKFVRKIGKIDDTHAAVEIEVQIHNTDETPFPVNVDASMTGLFDISNIEENDVESFLKVQSIQLILPHLRSLIASTTASALMTPILLPIYDARKLFPDNN